VSLNIPQLNGLPQPVTGITLPFSQCLNISDASALKEIPQKISSNEKLINVYTNIQSPKI
jgi:hypothetical protein